jgi:hypothetical protein
MTPGLEDKWKEMQKGRWRTKETKTVSAEKTGK